jgi:hypothetical protein
MKTITQAKGRLTNVKLTVLFLALLALATTLAPQVPSGKDVVAPTA